MANFKLVSPTFKLSQPQAISRMAYLQAGKLLEKPIPGFNKAGFGKDVKQIIERSNNTSELKRNVVAVVDEYIWPADSFTLALMGQDNIRMTGLEGRIVLSASDLDIDNPESFFNYVKQNGYATFIPVSDFSSCKGFYELPKHVMDLQVEGLTVKGVPDVDKLGISYESLAKKVNKHSSSIIFLPLENEGEEFGIMVFSFRAPYMFSENPGDLGYDHFYWMAMLANATSLTLTKLSKLGQQLA